MKIWKTSWLEQGCVQCCFPCINYRQFKIISFFQGRILFSIFVHFNLANSLGTSPWCHNSETCCLFCPCPLGNTVTCCSLPNPAVVTISTPPLKGKETKTQQQNCSSPIQSSLLFVVFKLDCASAS